MRAPACASRRLLFSTYQDMDRVRVCTAHFVGNEPLGYRFDAFGLKCVRQSQCKLKKFVGLAGVCPNPHIRD